MWGRFTYSPQPDAPPVPGATIDVRTHRTVDLKKLDEDFFSEEE